MVESIMANFGIANDDDDDEVEQNDQSPLASKLVAAEISQEYALNHSYNDKNYWKVDNHLTDSLDDMLMDY